jgi:hypothetical protein
MMQGRWQWREGEGGKRVEEGKTVFRSCPSTRGARGTGNVKGSMAREDKVIVER